MKKNRRTGLVLHFPMKTLSCHEDKAIFLASVGGEKAAPHTEAEGTFHLSALDHPDPLIANLIGGTRDYSRSPIVG